MAETKGKCVFCGESFSNKEFTSHLQSCEARKNKLKKGSSQDSVKEFLHFKITNAFNQDYWLHLEIESTASLQELDNYLRKIWLDCCGHLSSFFPGSSEWGNEISKETSITEALNESHRLTHIYDYKTSTKTMVEKVDSRNGIPLTQNPIFLLARNEQPEISCAQCDNTAKWLENRFGVQFDEYQIPVCDEHRKSESNEEITAYKIVNSPRMGVCKYRGPAQPPY